jgi:hypothetical protein
MTPPQDTTQQPPQPQVPSKETELSKAMYNPLAPVTKKADLKTTIASQQSSKSKKHDPNQISIQADKQENRLIKKRRFKEDARL